MTAHIQAYAALALCEKLNPFTYKQPKLNQQDVRVAVTHCVVCHTDIQAIDNHYGITYFPFIPGHEIVAFVSETGPAVTSLKEGDRIRIGWRHVPVVNMMHAMLSAAQANAIKPVVELMPMSQVNLALQKVKEIKALYRIVLINETAGALTQAV